MQKSTPLDAEVPSSGGSIELVQGADSKISVLRQKIRFRLAIFAGTTFRG